MVGTLADFNKEHEDLLKAFRKAQAKGKLFDPDAWKMRRERRRK